MDIADGVSQDLFLAVLALAGAVLVRGLAVRWANRQYA